MDSTSLRGIRRVDTRSKKAARPDNNGHSCFKEGGGNGESSGLGEDQGQGLEPCAMDADPQSCHAKIKYYACGTVIAVSFH
jgi:hypothetical protein